MDIREYCTPTFLFVIAPMLIFGFFVASIGAVKRISAMLAIGIAALVVGLVILYIQLRCPEEEFEEKSE